MQFHGFFVVLLSAISAGYKTVVLVGQNEHVYFCIFAEREFARENTSSVAKRIAKKCKIPKCCISRKYTYHGKNFSHAVLALLDD